MYKPQVIKQIAKTSEIIRRKHQALKRNKMDTQFAREENLEPIIAPLREIAQNAPKSEFNQFKREEQSTIGRREYTHDNTELFANDSVAETPMEHQEDLDESTAVYRRRAPKRPASDSLYSSTPSTINLARRYNVPKRSRQLFTTIAEDTFPLFSPNARESTSRSKLEMSVREALNDPTSNKEEAFGYFGPLAKEYINMLVYDRTNIADTQYGVHFGETDEFVIGNSKFDVDARDVLLIGGVRYKGTPGIFELLFKKVPDRDMITFDDMQKYKNILLTTNAYRKGYKSDGKIMGNKGTKWTKIIAPLLNSISGDASFGGVTHKTKGKGMMSLPREMRVSDNRVDYVHWDNPNELVDRLRLLVASRNAGHTAHDNEIVSIIEELREAGYIV